MKPLTLTAKEIRRACNGLTMVVRPQADGYMVALVSITTCLPVWKPSFVSTKAEISQAIKSDLRMADKCGFDCSMAAASRDRFYCV